MTHVERWRALTPRIQPQHFIGYPNLIDAWTLFGRDGGSVRGRSFFEHILSHRPATVAEAIELGARLPKPLTPGQIASHLPWIATWDACPGYPFVLILVP